MLTPYNSDAIKCAKTRKLACAANLTDKYCTAGTMHIILRPETGSLSTLRKQMV